MKPVLALMDSEEQYVLRFMEYVNRQQGSVFEVHAFSDFESLKAEMMQQAAEVLLIGEQNASKEIFRWNISKICYLTETKENGTDQETCRIYKYQPVSMIIKAVLQECADNNIMVGYNDMSDSRGILTGVFSPVGRCGKTSFALTLALLLSQEKPTLYLTFEFCTGFSELMHTVYKTGLSEAVFYLRSGEKTAGEKILADVCQIGELQYLPPFLSPEELLTVKETEWSCIIDAIVKTGRYKAIVLDLGVVPYCCPGILAVCGNVFEPVRQDSVSQAKIAEFHQFLEIRKEEESLKRIREITLPATVEIRPSDRYPELLPYGPLGSAAKEMIRLYDL